MDKLFKTRESSKDKRKREEKNKEESEVFRSSKLIVRSPDQHKSRAIRDTSVERFYITFVPPEERDMEELKKVIEELVAEIKIMREEQRASREEIDQIRKENGEIKRKMIRLEDKIEQNERKNKKCNIVIKGVEFNKMGTLVAVEEFLEETLGVAVKIKQTYEIKQKNGKTMNIVTLNKWEDKIKIMRNKNRLKGKNIYIDNDQTAKEREIQRKIREAAEKERKNGKKIRVAYQKLIVNDNIWIWNKEKEELEKRTDTKN